MSLSYCGFRIAIPPVMHSGQWVWSLSTILHLQIKWKIEFDASDASTIISFGFGWNVFSLVFQNSGHFLPFIWRHPRCTVESERDCKVFKFRIKCWYSEVSQEFWLLSKTVSWLVHYNGQQMASRGDSSLIRFCSQSNSFALLRRENQLWLCRPTDALPFPEITLVSASHLSKRLHLLMTPRRRYTFSA